MKNMLDFWLQTSLVSTRKVIHIFHEQMHSKVVYLMNIDDNYKNLHHIDFYSSTNLSEGKIILYKIVIFEEAIINFIFESCIINLII